MRSIHKISFIFSCVIFLIIILVFIFRENGNNNYEQNIDTGWTNQEKTEKIRECVDGGLSVGTCQCVVDVLSVEFSTLDDFDRQFDALANYLVEVFLTNDEIDVSQIDSFADKIRQCP